MGFAFRNGVAPFDLNSTYVDGSGNNVRFTKLKFFVYGITLEDDGGTQVAAFPSTILLVDLAAASNVFTLGTIDAGHVHEAHFSVGLDSASSYSDPTIAPFPLNQPDMRWDWFPASGTMFVKMDGYLDANANGNFDPGETAFSYHCIGQDMLSVEGQVSAHVDVTDGSTVTLAAKVDIAAVMAGLAFTTNHGDAAPNQQLVQNIAGAIAQL